MLGTFDVLAVNHTMLPGAIHLTVQYVEGSESPFSFYTKLCCVSYTINNEFNGSKGVINNVPPNKQCTLFVTDGDAAYFINTSAAVTIKGIMMPTTITYINNETHSTQPTPISGLDKIMFLVYYSKFIFFIYKVLLVLQE